MPTPPRFSWHTLAFLAAFVVLAALAWQGRQTQQALLDDSRAVRDSLELITHLKAMFSSLQDVETGQRGFILTGDAAYLEPYDAGRQALGIHRRQLERLLASRGALPQAWLSELDQTIAERLGIAERNILARRERGLDAAAAQLRRAGGKQAMDRLRTLLVELEERERQLLADETRRLAAQVDRSRQLGWLGSALVALLLIGAFWTIHRTLRARQAATLAAQAAAARLDALLQAVPDSLYEVDAEGRARPLNQAAPGEATPGDAIEPLLGALRNEAPQGVSSREWPSPAGDTFEVRLVPTGLGEHLAIARDVSEAQRHRRQLDDQRTFLRTVVDADANLIYVRNRLGRFLLCNEALAGCLGLRPDQLESRQPGELARGELLMPLLTGDLELIERGGEQRQDEVAMTDAQGNERWLQLLKRPLQLSDGSRQVIAVAVDITERRRMERLKAEFTATVSHELRTPLTAIRGSLGMVNSGLVGEVAPSMRPMLEIAQKNSERLVRLINDILDIEKLEAGRLSLSLARHDARALVELALGSNAAYAQEFGVRLALADDAPTGTLQVDADRFAQIMANLLSNAAKHSPAGATVSVSLARLGETLEIAVTDQGTGIPESFRGHIFQRFAQADASDQRSRGGTGLGLAITRSLVEQMHGEIGFDSTPGEGSRFHVRFPLAEGAPVDSAAAPPVVPAPALPAEPAAAGGVLMVEPDGIAAHQLGALLEAQGFAVRGCASLDEARQLLASEPFQAVTLSPNLTGEQGMSFLQELRDQPALRRLPVLVVGLQPGTAATGLQGGAVGVMDWLQEPLDTERVMAVMRACLGQARGRPNVLHVEDDPDLRLLLANQLRGQAVELHAAGSLAEARRQLERRTHALAILDLMLPDGDGSELLADLARTEPPTPVIIFSAADALARRDGLVLRQLVKSRHDGSELATLIGQYLAHWPGAEPSRG